MRQAPTRLEQDLAGNGHPHRTATPLDAFRLARRTFLAKKRVDMSELAAELGVGRATLYRWVGSRDRLLGEILWSLTERGLEQCRADATGEGAEWVISIWSRFGELIVDNEPLLHWVRSEPETALRVMTTKHSPQQERIIEAYERILDEAIATKGLKPRLDTHTLAFVLIRVAESFLWTDLITGEAPDLTKGNEVARVLLT